MHPAEDGYHELWLMCEDVYGTTKQLQSKGVELAMPISDRGWGFVTKLKLPSGDQIGLYQPKHPTALNLSSRRGQRSKPSKAGVLNAGAELRTGEQRKTNPRASASPTI